MGSTKKFQYFDTIIWGPWIGESVSDSVGSPNALSSKYVLSRMSYMDHARLKKVPMLKQGERITMWQIKQSGLGICYLYDAIGMMAKWGFLEEPGLSESGVYKVTIFDQREQRRRGFCMMEDDKIKNGRSGGPWVAQLEQSSEGRKILRKRVFRQ